MSDLAGSALKAGITAMSVIFQIFTIALFTFYMVADGPRLRRTICSCCPANGRSSSCRRGSSRSRRPGATSTPASSSRCCRPCSTGSRSTILGVPYALALALWVGIISQFIPVVGTYLAGALAVLVALLNDPVDGLAVLIFVVVYQQIENYIFVPRVTAQTLELHPAVAFGTVIAGAAILGPVGALLALPQPR